MANLSTVWTDLAIITAIALLLVSVAVLGVCALGPSLRGSSSPTARRAPASTARSDARTPHAAHSLIIEAEILTALMRAA